MIYMYILSQESCFSLSESNLMSNSSEVKESPKLIFSNKQPDVY